MIRYAIGITYPNGKKDWSEYRTKEENFARAKQLKEWSDKNNKGWQITVFKYERLYGSNRTLETFDI